MVFRFEINKNTKIARLRFEFFCLNDNYRLTSLRLAPDPGTHIVTSMPCLDFRGFRLAGKWKKKKKKLGRDSAAALAFIPCPSMAVSARFSTTGRNNKSRPQHLNSGLAGGRAGHESFCDSAEHSPAEVTSGVCVRARRLRERKSRALRAQDSKRSATRSGV